MNMACASGWAENCASGCHGGPRAVHQIHQVGPHALPFRLPSPARCTHEAGTSRTTVQLDFRSMIDRSARKQIGRLRVALKQKGTRQGRRQLAVQPSSAPPRSAPCRRGGASSAPSSHRPPLGKFLNSLLICCENCC